ncbi:MAG: hypothetical protein AAB447_03435 [Patescibacteria group bacterium]
MAREDLGIVLSPQEEFGQRRKIEGRMFECKFWGMPPPDPEKPVIQSVPAYAKFEEVLALVEAHQLAIPNWNPYDPKIGLAAKLFPLVSWQASISGLMLLNANFAPNALDQYHNADGVFFLRSPRTYLVFDLTISHSSLDAKNGKHSPAEFLIRPRHLDDDCIEYHAGMIARRMRELVDQKRERKRAHRDKRKLFREVDTDEEYVGERV